MKALVLEDYMNLVYKDVPEPEYEPDEVIVQVKACGICGSDVHGMDGSSGRRFPPIIMGHEASGIVTKTGQNVKYWQVGDRVTFDSTMPPIFPSSNQIGSPSRTSENTSGKVQGIVAGAISLFSSS